MLFLLAWSALFACGKPAPVADAGSPVLLDLSPVPAPKDLVGRFFIAQPDATWAKARAAIGGPAGLLPPSFGGLALTLLQLPITLTGEVDGTIPVVGAVVRGATRPQMVIGVHVRAGDRFVDMVTKGQDARFVAKPDPASSIVMLEPKAGGRASAAIGVLGNYVVAARRAEDLAAVGPYVARTMPTLSPPKDDLAFEIDDAALAGPIKDGAQAILKQMDAVASAKGAASPSDVVGSFVDLLPDLAGASVTVNLDATTIHARAAAKPKTPDGPAAKTIGALEVGDDAPLLELPEAAIVGVLARSRAGTPGWSIAEDAILKRFEGAPPADVQKIKDALGAISDARGAWGSIGLTLAPTGPTVFARAPITDADKMNKALDRLLGVAKLASVKDELKKSGVSVDVSSASLTGFPGAVHLVKLTRAAVAEAPAGKQPSSAKKSGAEKDASATEIAIVVGKDKVFAAVGSDPMDGLKAVVSPEKTIASDAEVKSALEAVGSDAAIVGFFDPLRLIVALGSRSSAGSSPPVIFALTRTGAEREVALRLDVPVAVVQEAAKRGAL